MDILSLPDDCLSLILRQCISDIIRQVCTQFWHVMNRTLRVVHLHSGDRRWESLPFSQARRLKCGLLTRDLLDVICRDGRNLESLMICGTGPDWTDSNVTDSAVPISLCQSLHVRSPAKKSAAAEFNFSVSVLRSFPHLRVLVIDNAKLVRGSENLWVAALSSIAVACPLLEICQIKTSSVLMSSAIPSFFHSLPHLQVFKLACTWVDNPLTDYFLAAASCPRLRVLHFRCDPIRWNLDMHKVLDTLMDCCPELTECVIPWEGNLELTAPPPASWMRLRRIHLNALPDPEHFPNLTHFFVPGPVVIDDLVPFRQLEVVKAEKPSSFRAVRADNDDMLFELHRLRRFDVLFPSNYLWLDICPGIVSIAHSGHLGQLGNASFPQIKKVTQASMRSGRDAGCRSYTVFPNLEHLTIGACDSNPEFFFQRTRPQIRGFAHLKFLRMFRCRPIGKRMLDNVAFHCPLLEELIFDECTFLQTVLSVTFEAYVLRMVGELPHLRVLQIPMEQASEEFLTKLQGVAPRLDFLILPGCTDVARVKDLRFLVV